MLATFLFLLTVAIVGAVFGSFANVVAIRTHEHSTLMGRSHCVHCGTTLKARHLVPILSWLVQRGRCTECHKKIHIQYPLVELAGAVLAVLAVIRHVPGTNGWMWASFEFFFGMCLLVFVAMDIRWRELPLEFMVGTGAVFSLWNMLLQVASGTNALEVAWSHAIGFGIVTLFFLFQWIVSRKRWIGSGDIWLGALLGAVLGWPSVGIALYLAYIFGGTAALILLLSKKIPPGSRVPFAPALVAGALGAMWWGEAIVSWISHAIS